MGSGELDSCAALVVSDRCLKRWFSGSSLAGLRIGVFDDRGNWSGQIVAAAGQRLRTPGAPGTVQSAMNIAVHVAVAL